MMHASPLDLAVRTDPGRDPDKQINEDLAGHRATRLGHLVVVCDGMGGHVGGREASEAALAAIFATFDAAREGEPPGEVLRRSIEAANLAVWKLAPPDVGASRPGSTAVAILVHAAGTEIAHVGDSRAYVIHHGGLVPLTRDHSLVRQMVDAGMLAPEHAKGHPDANRITRALGTRDVVEVELAPTYAHVAGDVFVLASDGLTDMVEDADILRLASSSPPEQAAGQLVDLANARGGHDNITVVVARAKTSAASREGGVAPTLVATVAEAPAPAATPPVLPPVPPGSGPLPIVPGARPPRSRQRPIALVGLVLAAVAILAALIALFLRSRRPAVGADAESTLHLFADAGAPPVSPAPPPDAETELVPEPVPSGPDLSHVEPLGHLPDGGRRRHGHGHAPVQP